MTTITHSNRSRSLVISTKTFPPYVNPCGLRTLLPSKNCSRPGRDNELLGYLLEFLKIDYQIIPSEDAEWGEPTGNRSRLIGLTSMVDMGEIDTMSVSWSISAQRAELFDFSYPHLFHKNLFVTRKGSDDVIGTALTVLQCERCASGAGLYVSTSTLVVCFSTR